MSDMRGKRHGHGYMILILAGTLSWELKILVTTHFMLCTSQSVPRSKVLLDDCAMPEKSCTDRYGADTAGRNPVHCPLKYMQ